MWTEEKIEEKAKEILTGWRKEGYRYMSISTSARRRCDPVRRLDSDTDTDTFNEYHAVLSRTALKAVITQIREELKDEEKE